jgi:hypothetical protein
MAILSIRNGKRVKIVLVSRLNLKNIVLLRRNNMFRYNKYNNKKVEYDGYKFDSIKECTRYKQLKLLERARTY